MRLSHMVLVAAASVAQGIRIVQSNDDGWAELYFRALNTALKASGHQVILSGPAENKSGAGSRDSEPQPRTSACDYNSCAADAKTPWGVNATSPDLFWVNSYPATSMRYAIDTFAPQVWGPDSPPELAVTGPNVGANVFVEVPFSGTVGAACHAVRSAGIPAIAFSSVAGTNARWDADPVPQDALLYADLAANLTERIIASGKPYLPPGVFLNVNFPHLGDGCNQMSQFSWVLTRIYPSNIFTAPDVETCGSTRLPADIRVAMNGKCQISVSVGDAADKTTVNDGRQKMVLDKLGDMLTCRL